MAGQESETGDGLRGALHSSTAFLDELRKQFIAGNNIANPPVFLKAATLNDEGLPVIKLITQMFSDGQPFGEIATFAIPVIRHCKRVSADALIGLLDAVSARNSQETMLLAGEIHTVVKRDVKFGYDCLERVLKGDMIQVSTAASLAVAIAQAERKECVPYFIALSEREGECCSEVALCALATLDGKDLAQAGCIEDLRKVFHAAKSEGRWSAVAFNFLCRLASFDAVSIRELRECVLAGSEGAFLAGIRWLRFASPEMLKPEVLEFLLELARLSVQNPKHLSEVESNLATYLYNPESRPVAYDMLDIVSEHIRWDFGHARSGPSYAVISDKQVLSKVASKWLLQDVFLKDALGSLLTLGVPHGQTIPADFAEFSIASPKARRRAVHRLLGLSNSGTLVAGLLLELALDSRNRSWAEAAFLDVVGNYLCAEFPGEIRDFLKTAIAKIPRGNFRKAAAELLKSVLDWGEVLESLPVLPELSPTRDRRMTLRLAVQRRDAQISRMVEEKSIMSQLVSRSYIKQGRRFAVRMPDGSTTMTEMKTVSFEFELPSSEVLDPLEALLSRMAYVSGGSK
ncbi:hypothetical protein [Paraburkholderia tropica]|uniref:hypothetical protein n=1 Tax=Paraburkholderia tropica TaxID=92647 RepID=UPI002AB75924|nr:hypothetical protein [Paraburkholderia tropica]